MFLSKGKTPSLLPKPLPHISVFSNFNCCAANQFQIISSVLRLGAQFPTSFTHCIVQQDCQARHRSYLIYLGSVTGERLEKTERAEPLHHLGQKALHKQSRLELVAQVCVQLGFEHLQRCGDPTPLGNLCNCLNPLTLKKCFLMFTVFLMPAASCPVIGHE